MSAATSSAMVSGRSGRSTSAVRAVPLQVDRDDPPAGGERGHDRAEHLAGADTAVQQDERLAGAVLLVVQRHTVHVCVAHGVLLARLAIVMRMKRRGPRKLIGVQ